jgi:signal transduction histidine kinase
MTTTLSAEDIQIVRKMPLFAGLSDDNLSCITAGEIVDFPVGAVLASENAKDIHFFMIVEGAVQIWRSYDRQDVLMATGGPGDFMGEIPILLDSTWLATARVSKPVKLFRLSPDAFWHMLGACPSVTRIILRTVAERFRNLEGFASQREKLVSLGTMAAGLAHELNNPAAAALRASKSLQQASDSVQVHLCDLGHNLDSEHWEPLMAASEQATQLLDKAVPLDSIARSDQEEVVASWFDQHNIPDGWKLCGTFVQAGIGVPWLETFISGLPPASHPAAIGWLEARLNLKLLLKQIENSSSRIAELVKAVKSYTHMDQAPMQEIDIHEGIESTLTMLSHKLKSVCVRRAFDRTIPKTMAYAGELNQVWTNLIDNAVDATEGKGKICVGTFLDNDHIIVEIVDNGPGIPPEVQKHIFEPFFTTKAVGSGTGLGLVISHRIVGDRHGGEIEFESKPGETCFRVRLPIRYA